MSVHFFKHINKDILTTTCCVGPRSFMEQSAFVLGPMIHDLRYGLTILIQKEATLIEKMTTQLLKNQVRTRLMKTDWPENKLFLRGLTNFPRFDCIYEKLWVSWFSSPKMTSYSILVSHIRPDLAQSKCRVRYCNVIVTKNRWLVSIEMVKILLSQIQNCGISIELSRFGFTASLSYSLPRVHPFKSSCFWFDTVSLIHPTWPNYDPKTPPINLNSHNLGFTLTENCTPTQSRPISTLVSPQSLLPYPNRDSPRREKIEITNSHRELHRCRW